MAVNYRYVGIGAELTYGTTVSITKYIPITTADFKTNHQVEHVEAAAAPYREDPNIAKSHVVGDLAGYAGPEVGLGWLFKNFFGAITSAQQGATAAYLHTFECPIDHGGQSSSLLLGKEDNEFSFGGCLVTDIELTWTHPGYIMWKATIVGKAEGTVVLAKNTPSWSTKAFFHGTEFNNISINGSANSSLTAFNIKLSRSFDLDAYFAGSVTTFEAQPKPSRLTVNGSLSFSSEQAAVRTLHVAGTTHAILIEVIGATIAGSYKDLLGILMDDCILTEASGGIDMRNREGIQYNFEAYYDTSNTRTVRVQLQNAVTAYADAS
jgi:hypothetical protein